MFGLKGTAPGITQSNRFSWQRGKIEARDFPERPRTFRVRIHSWSGSVVTGSGVSRRDISRPACGCSQLCSQRCATLHASGPRT